MSSKSPLKWDLNNLFQPAMPDGVPELGAFEAAFRQAHHGVQALRGTGQLAFSHVPRDEAALGAALSLSRDHAGVRNVVVFGIGGSALGAKSIHHALCGPFAAHDPKAARFFVVDNIEPRVLEQLAALIRDEDNLFVFISKSGNTSETLAQYLFCKRVFPRFGRDNVVVVTGPKGGVLGELAGSEGYAGLAVPTGVGGRFSVFTPVGIFPLAAAGVNVRELLDGAAQAERACHADVLAQNPAALLAFTLDFWCRRGCSQLALMPYADRLVYFADWAAQLFAESLNKKATLAGGKPAYGLTVLKALGATDQHSQLQLYLDGPRDKVTWFVAAGDECRGELAPMPEAAERLGFLSGKSLAALLDAERRATEASLRENGRPSATIHLPRVDAFHLGSLYQTFMNVVPYLGALLDINPYDQPAVERIKKFTFGLMGRPGYDDFAGICAGYSKRPDLVF